MDVTFCIVYRYGVFKSHSLCDKFYYRMTDIMDCTIIVDQTVGHQRVHINDLQLYR